ncbi:MAG: YegS/Rv2252/BmrU family lipid kinase [Candidatus Thermoplasmatota archaeon]|nr:YegS/Rv2252/BmrU family lipid kinase [Candidatus Thermoplasmatota archaeon]
MNPEAGSGRFRMDPEELERRFMKAARSSGTEIDIEVVMTEVAGDAEKISRERRDSRIDVIAACGGDGTIYEVVNGSVGSGKGIGIVPLGSGNDGIVSITGLHRSIDDCISDIIRCDRHPLDIARMNDRYFLNVVGVGMDAAINHQVADRRDLVKRVGPTVLYTYCTFRVIPGWKDMEVLIELDDEEPMQIKAKMLTIGNGTTCGGGFRLTPKARMDDGLLDLSLIKSAGVLRTVLNVPKAFKGEHLNLDLTFYKKFRRMKVISLEDRELPLHIDGEKGFSREFEFEAVSGKIWTVHRLGARPS